LSITSENNVLLIEGMLMGKENRSGLVALTYIFSVELPGIELGAEIGLKCGDADSDYAKLPAATREVLMPSTGRSHGWYRRSSSGMLVLLHRLADAWHFQRCRLLYGCAPLCVRDVDERTRRNHHARDGRQLTACGWL